MQPDRVQAIYQDLMTLSVVMEHSPQMGLAYYSDKMLECRQKQDRVADLLVEVNRDYSRVRHGIRSQKALVLLLRASTNTGQLVIAERALDGLEGEEDELRYLLESVKTKSSNLRMTSSDIRLLSGNAEALMKNGPVTPTAPTRQPDAPAAVPSQAEQLSTSPVTATQVAPPEPQTATTAIVETESAENSTVDIEALLAQL